MNSRSLPVAGIKISFITALLVLSACAVNPVTGKKQIALMSEQQEIALGAESDPQIITQFGLYDHPGMQKFIDEHGQSMARISHRPELKFHFRILDSPVVNAFAVPGGYVYFTRGIMAHFNNEAQFAGVLGHEIGHITARHSVEQYTKQTLAQVLFIGGLLVSKELRTFANEAQTAMGLLFLKYSRDNESQSDELGVEYSTRIGYDAAEMAGFFKTLKALSAESGSEIPTFLSTHPDPADRYENVKKLAVAAQAKYPAPSFKINRDSYLAMVDGVVYGEDPRQGYVEASVFYHPDLKFLFPVPANWKLVNSPAQVQMAPENGKALIMFTLVEGNSLQAAASNTASQLKLTVTASRQITVNGLQALEVLSEQVTQDPSTGQQSRIVVKSVYIQYGGHIYVFHGVSTPLDFSSFISSFDKTMFGFKELKDPAKINVTPEKIMVVAVKQSGTLSQALQSYNMASNRHKELAIVNGMELADPVTAGAKIKIIRK
jgi:predicted Zn-dependent protease